MSDPIPTIRTAAGVTEITWTAQRVKAMVSRMHTSREGAVTAELHLKRIRENGQEAHIELCSLNLLSSPTKTQLAKKLNENCPLDAVDTHWGLLIEQLTLVALQHCREGEPPQILDTTAPANPPVYLLDPLLQRGQPTVLFGLGGTGKSYLSMMLAITVALPYSDNRLSWWPGEQPHPVVWLDWETNYDICQWRLHKIQAGMKLPDVKIHYRRCALPLAADIETIAGLVIQTGAKMVVVDSVAPACGGDLREAVALDMFRALRYLGNDVTSLLIGHTSKPQPGDSPKQEKTPFGSAFFGNAARSSLEVRADPDADEDTIQVAVFNRKENDRHRDKPWGMTITFGEETVTFKRTDVADMKVLSESLSQPVRILHFLKAGPASREEIALELDANEETTRVVLARMIKAGQVVKVGDLYGLLATKP